MVKKRGLTLLVKLASTAGEHLRRSTVLLAAASDRTRSLAGTGFFYVKRKNPRKLPQRLQLVKHDPVVNKHVLFTEQKLK